MNPQRAVRALVVACLVLGGVGATPVRAALLAPTAVDDAYTLVGDGPLVVAAPGVLGNDERGVLDTAALRAPAGHGTVVLAQDGSFKYSPDAGYRGTDAFRYRIETLLSHSGDASVTITIVAPTPTPTPTPTPRPTPTPTPRPTLPLPSLPLPSLPLPSLPPPTAIPTAVPSVTPQPTVPPTPPPTIAPTPTPAGTAEPTPVPAQRPSDVGPIVPIPPPPSSSPTAPTSSPEATLAVPVDVGEGRDRPLVVDSDRLVLGGFEWQVPGLLLSVPGLLLILAVAFQLLGGLAWIPLIRRRLGTFGLRLTGLRLTGLRLTGRPRR
jgi:hypothetical protein